MFTDKVGQGAIINLDKDNEMDETYETLKRYLLSLKKGELQGDEFRHFIKGLQILNETGELTKEQFHDLLMVYLKQTSNIG